MTIFHSIIGSGLKVEGTLWLNQSTRIDALIDGNIFQQDGCNITIAFGQSAVVTGNVIANQIVISGKIRGDIVAHKNLELLSTASIVGAINYASIKINAGAKVSGLLKFEPPMVSETSNTTMKI